MDTGFVAREQGRALAELSEFLSIPSVSTQPDHAADCRRAADGWSPTSGSSVCRWHTYRGARAPVVWAEGPRVPGEPTLLIYGHYDVQPPDPLDEWVTPPFKPTVRDGKLFARGAADDKGQVSAPQGAMRPLEAAHGTPPLNIHFIIEGEEECGGDGSHRLLTRSPNGPRADAVLVCDMSYMPRAGRAVYTALRGMCYAESPRAHPAGDLHCGPYGGAAPNAIETLVPPAEKLKGEDGRIRIPGLYDRVTRRPAKELQGLARAAHQGEALLRKR